VGLSYEPLFENASAIQMAGWLEKIYKLYKHYQLNEDAEKILLRMRGMGEKAAQEMGSFEQRFEIPKEKIEELTGYIYATDAETALSNIFTHFTPVKETAKQMLLELAREAPMQYSFPIQLQDGKGRTITTVGPIGNDLEGHILLKISEHLQYSAFPLHLVLEYGVNNKILTPDIILEFLSKSAIINSSRLTLFSKALQYYFTEDYLGFIHVVIPQIEEALRNMVEINGGNVLKFKNDAFNLKLFDEIIRNPIVNSILGDDIQTYLRIVLSDPRGWNLRNETCHGMLEIEQFNKQSADRVLHTVLCLGLVRMQAK
jgi:hypothetical protein